MGLACLIGRLTLFHTAVDAAGLLRPGTALEWGIYALTALALLLFAFSGEIPKPQPKLAALGQLAGGVGIGWTVLRYSAQMPGVLEILWKLSGVLAALCLLGTALWTLRGKTSHFLVQLMPCLFWLIHTVDHYRSWSGQPQLQTYLFELFAAMALALFSYHTAAFPVGMGKPRIWRFSALSAGYLSMAAAFTEPTRVLYLLCGIWAATGLYAEKEV